MLIMCSRIYFWSRQNFLQFCPRIFRRWEPGCVTCSYNAFNIGTFAASSIYMFAIKMAHKRWEKNGKIQQLFSFYVIFFLFLCRSTLSLFGSRARRICMYACTWGQRYVNVICICAMVIGFYMCSMPVSPSLPPRFIYPRNIFTPPPPNAANKNGVFGVGLLWVRGGRGHCRNIFVDLRLPFSNFVHFPVWGNGRIVVFGNT